MKQAYAIVQKPPMMFVGIERRTSNAPDAAPHDIPQHWEKFFRENVSDNIPHKLSPDIYALYCDYDGDYTQPYSIIIGSAVQPLNKVPKGMVARIIPSTKYALFRAIGKHPQSITETWSKIWNTDLARQYSVDFELYGDKFTHSPKEVEVYIALLNNAKARKLDRVEQHNHKKFAVLKKLSLPTSHYAVTGSGPLGIRNLREIGDIDILVSNALWDQLAAKYGVSTIKGEKKIVFPDGDIEAIGSQTFDPDIKYSNTPPIPERIAQADSINGLPFESLEHVLFYKRLEGREKDLKDISLVENYLASVPY